MWPWLRAQAARAGRAAVAARGVVVVLQLLIVMELCVLGVGVVRRMESAYTMAYEASRMEYAVLEQQRLMRERAGAPSGGGDAAAGLYGNDAMDEAPKVRVRDIPTIIAETTGDMEAAVAVMMGNGSADAADEEPEESATEPDDEAAETDALIRRGVTALIAGDMRLCVLSLEQASALSPNHPAMLYYYGMAYDKLLNPQKAREYYKRLLQMREQAGPYFARAARRMTYGVEQGSALRGKLAFGPHRVQHTFDMEQGERVSLLLPIMLAPGEEIRADEVNLHVEFFDLVNGSKVDFAREEPVANWVNEVQNWRNGEEDLVVNYTVPPSEENGIAGGSDTRYYGFIAKLFYKGEPMDCISSPSSLILYEQQLSRRSRGWGGAPGLLPDDGLDPGAEQAVPYAEIIDDTTANTP